MHYVARPPAPALARFVEYLWASQGSPAQAVQRVVPTGTVELCVSLVEGEGRIADTAGGFQVVSGAFVAGAYRRPFTFEARADGSAVGVHFKPGCAGVVLGVPAGELVDRHVPLEALWGWRARELRERLCAANTTAERFAILETELVSRLCGRGVHPAVEQALGLLARPSPPIGDIAREVGISRRRLIELFTAAVGLAPKRFDRVIRFQRAISLARCTRLPWTHIAHECGYYDQAHLIRDCRELAGMTPGDLLRASAHEREQHQLGVAAG